MKKILSVLLMAASLLSTAQKCVPSNHIYIGGGIGGGYSPDHAGFLAGINSGVFTRVIGVDVSITSFPSPSSPSFFSGYVTKSFIDGNSKLTIGAGTAYKLVTTDNKDLNGWNWAGYFELARLTRYEGGAFFFRASVCGNYIMATIGIQGIFKQQ